LFGKDVVIGYSTHNPEQLVCAAGELVDYVALGPVYGTTSKRNPDPVVGVENLREWRPLVPQPLVAIGGITRENAPAVWMAGADMVAVIGDLYPEKCDARAVRERMEAWTQTAEQGDRR
jgi:thiamine-phosphate pyrophosphorylase